MLFLKKVVSVFYTIPKMNLGAKRYRSCTQKSLLQNRNLRQFNFYFTRVLLQKSVKPHSAARINQGK